MSDDALTRLRQVVDAGREFPVGASEPDPGMNRRSFFQLLGASAALAGAGAACAQAPSEKIIPYTDTPPEVTPGVARHYATAMVLDGLATGIVVEAHEGRPTKIEGNPLHPSSLGGAGPLEQAHVLGLYDPQRASVMRDGNEPRTKAQLFAWLAGLKDGVGLLLPPTSSPTVLGLIAAVRARLPDVRVAFHSAGAWRLPVTAHPDFTAAEVIVSLDADFLASGASWLAHARRFAERRRGAGNRLYQIETSLTPTGSLADHRLRARPSEVLTLATALAAAVGGAPASTPTPWLAAVARDLLRHKGRCAVIAGDRQPLAVHAAAQTLNAALDAAVTYTPPAVFQGDGLAVLEDVRTLLILGGNPVYDTPADAGFGERLAQLPATLYLGEHENETARACRFFVPALHPLESWGDARAADGTASIIQPLIAPLVADGVQAEEILAALAGKNAKPRDLVRAQWSALDEPAWERALQRGLIDGTAFPKINAGMDLDAVSATAPALPATAPAAEGLELSLVLDGKVHDGRFADNAWLQELPAPMTKLTWDNAALLSLKTAQRLNVTTGDVVRLTYRGRTLDAPAFVLPGHADECVTLALGYGRTVSGPVGQGVGVNAFLLQAADAPFGGPGLSVERTPGKRALAVTQEHWTVEGRPIALTATVAEARARDVTQGQKRPLATLLDEHYTPQAKQQWAMSIDLSTCTGCSACVVACQAENNTPVVGRSGVAKSREMHWLRIDRYVFGSDENPRVVNQPMMCQHCEKAPCEYVCPVGATVHSDDGLNEMVYNRCIGTRFCSNNCPYKVRRFNFFDYVAADRTALQKNPDVTVRSRGVMEKCTYCVQRIRRAEIDARLADRDLRDGDVRTACQQACPTQAITFGSISDPASAVSKAHAERHSYQVLHELGAKPRTEYLVKLRNPNPEIGE